MIIPTKKKKVVLESFFGDFCIFSKANKRLKGRGFSRILDNIEIIQVKIFFSWVVGQYFESNLESKTDKKYKKIRYWKFPAVVVGNQVNNQQQRLVILF